MLTWAHEHGVALRLIAPGKPTQNAYIESFTGRFRDECLNEGPRRAHARRLRTTANQGREYSHRRALKPTATQGGGTSKVPSELYTPSPRPYRGLPTLDYPFHDWTATVTNCGRICYKRRKVNLSQVFAGQEVGVRQIQERVWLVTFMHYDFGYVDDETCRLEPLENPFSPKVLPMCPE
jgi:putative transposase